MKTMKLLSQEIGVSESYIKDIKAKYLVENKHFFKKLGKIYIDETAFYQWIKERDENIRKEQDSMGRFIHKRQEVSL